MTPEAESRESGFEQAGSGQPVSSPRTHRECARQREAKKDRSTRVVRQAHQIGRTDLRRGADSPRGYR
jgi:hypothetical protein